MRVLMTADAVGGVWTYALELAAALRPHGVVFDVATMGPGPDEHQRREAAFAGVGDLHVSAFALEWQDDPWMEVERAGAWLLHLAARMKADLVHLNGYAHAPLPWGVPVIVVAHSDVLSWWNAVKGASAGAGWERYRQAVQAGLRAADAVCAPTQAMLAALRANYDLAVETFVVPHGRTDRPVVRPKEPLVAGVGRFDDEAKNLATLTRIAEHSPWRVVLVGPGTRVGRVPRERVTDLLARASVFAGPARYEPFGLSALEAAQTGCALVLGNIPSLREVWGDAALYADPDDHEGLLAHLRVLAVDAERLAALGARARARARRYTPQAMAYEMLSVYERVLAARRRMEPR